MADTNKGNVTFTGVKVDLSYVGNKQVDTIGDLSVKVQDSFQATLSWDIEIKSLPIKKNHYKANVIIPAILITFLKSFSVKGSNFEISEFSHNLTVDMLSPVKYNATVPDK